MFYRSAADQKLASLEARISRLENRMVRKAARFESTIDAIYQKINRLPGDLAYVASMQLGVDYDPSSLNKFTRVKKAGLSLIFPGLAFIPGTDIELSMIDQLDEDTIEITLIPGGMASRKFVEKYGTYSDKHLRVLAGLIVKNAQTLL